MAPTRPPASMASRWTCLVCVVRRFSGWLSSPEYSALLYLRLITRDISLYGSEYCLVLSCIELHKAVFLTIAFTVCRERTNIPDRRLHRAHGSWDQRTASLMCQHMDWSNFPEWAACSTLSSLRQRCTPVDHQRMVHEPLMTQDHSWRDRQKDHSWVILLPISSKQTGAHLLLFFLSFYVTDLSAQATCNMYPLPRLKHVP